MKRKLLRHPFLWALVVLGEAVILIVAGLTATNGRLADASPITIQEYNQTQHVNGDWAQEIADHPAEAILDEATTARVNQAIAASKPPMTAEERTGFVTGVQAMQAKLRTSGLTKQQHDHFVSVLRRRGQTAIVAEQLFNDPIALVTIAIDTVTEQPVQSNAVQESFFTDAKTGKKYGFANTFGSTCGTTTSTDPYLTRSGYALAGDLLWRVKYIKSWCWQVTYLPVPYLPITTITSAPSWSPPQFKTTQWCIGCDFTVDFHKESWYAYSPPYPLTCTSRCGYAQKVNFHIKQCFGIGPIAQCMSPDYEYWRLNLHADGTFAPYYS